MTRQIAPAADRNKAPILDVLRHHLPPTGLVLEVASGTGQHVAHFAEALPALEWQPSDPSPIARRSIAAWVEAMALPNLRAPLDLEAASANWPIARADAVLCINMIHISPWAATEGLMTGSSRILPRNGLLFLYGPYKREGRHTAPSNEAFDADLRSRDPRWGVRDLESVMAAGAARGFRLEEVVEMPANNLSVVLRMV